LKLVSLIAIINLLCKQKSILIFININIFYNVYLISEE
jgi:hypothetical protein